MTEYPRKEVKPKKSHIEMGKKNCCISPMTALLQSQHGLGLLERKHTDSVFLWRVGEEWNIYSVPATRGLPEDWLLSPLTRSADGELAYF